MSDDDRFWIGPASAPDTYQLITCLGGGAEGEVWTAVLPLSAEGRRSVAVKIMPDGVDGSDEESWINHGHLLRSIAHPGLVRVIEVFTGPVKHRSGEASSATARYVVMDLIEGVTLREWLDDNPDATISQRLRALVTVAAALDEMHSGAQTRIPVAHGDVKPSNIVLREDRSTVLVDLGLTRLTDGAGRGGRSRPYAAPELFAPDSRSTPEADRFAFAATVVHVLLGDPPPVSAAGGPDLDQVAARLQASPLTARRPILVSKLMEVLSAAPADRPPVLRVWLGSLTDTLSQVTGSLDGTTTPGAPVDATQVAPAFAPSPPVAANASRRSPRTPLLIGAAVLVVAVLVVAGIVIVKGSGSGNKNLASGQTAGLTNPTVTTTTPAAVTTTPAPTAPPTVVPSDTVTAPPSGPASGAPTGAPTGIEATGTMGPAQGTPLSGDNADDFVTGTTGGVSEDYGNMNIDGKVSVTGFRTDSCCSNENVYQSSISIDLGRDYKTFTARLGEDDGSTKNISDEVKIYGDNRLLYKGTFTLGHAYTQPIDVTGVLRLEIDFKGRLYAAPFCVGDPAVQ